MTDTCTYLVSLTFENTISVGVIKNKILRSLKKRLLNIKILVRTRQQYNTYWDTEQKFKSCEYVQMLHIKNSIYFKTKLPLHVTYLGI